MPAVKWGLISAVFALVVSVFLGIISGVSAFYIFLRALIFTVIFFGIGFGLRFVINNFIPELLLSDNENPSYDEDSPRVDITVDNSGEYAVPELYKTSGGPAELGNIQDIKSGQTGRSGELPGGKTPGRQPSDQWFDSDGTSGAAGLDLMKKDGYNGLDGGDVFQETNVYESFSTAGKSPAESKPSEKAKFSPGFGNDTGLGGLPDFDTMARAFSGSGLGQIPSQAPSSSPASFTPVSASGADFSPMSSMGGMFETEAETSRNTGNKSQPLEGDFAPKDIARGISTLLNKD